MDELRSLACKLGIANKIKDIPDSWLCDKKAGKDRALCFLQNISIRKPEATSIQRMANLINIELQCFLTI